MIEWRTVNRLEEMKNKDVGLSQEHFPTNLKPCIIQKRAILRDRMKSLTNSIKSYSLKIDHRLLFTFINLEN